MAGRGSRGWDSLRHGEEGRALHGADGKPHETLEWSPKTYAVRTIPIPDRTVEALTSLKAGSDSPPYLYASPRRLATVDEKNRTVASV